MVEDSESNLRDALQQSMELSSKDRLANVEVAVSDLNSKFAYQTAILEEIQKSLAHLSISTAGLVTMWESASGAWKVLQVISKFVKVVTPIGLAIGVFWGVFTHATVENLEKVSRFFK